MVFKIPLHPSLDFVDNDEPRAGVGADLLERLRFLAAKCLRL
jgi:hypothetical protein